MGIDGIGGVAADLGPPAPANAPAAHEYDLDFTHSLFVAGCLHIIHNMTKDLLAQLSQSGPFVDQLKHICRISVCKIVEPAHMQILKQKLSSVCFIKTMTRSR